MLLDLIVHGSVLNQQRANLRKQINLEALIINQLNLKPYL
jgi:hypothetical protein